MDEEQIRKAKADMKARVMHEIKKKKICMVGSGSLLAKKLGLECAIAASLLAGAFLISLSFYVLKKAKILKFLSLGFPGLKVFLLSIPYGYIALFAGAIIVALYLANKLDLPYETKIAYRFVVLILLGIILAAGCIFILAGVHEYFKGLAENKIPKDISIYGKIRKFSDGDIIIEEEDGQAVEVRLNEYEQKLIKEKRDIEGKYFRAVGSREVENSSRFRAEYVLCCDED